MDTLDTLQQTTETPKKKTRSGLFVTLAILLGLFIVIGLLSFNAWRVLFNPSLVKESLTEEFITSELVPATLEVFSTWRAKQRFENKESLSGVNEPDIVLLVSFMKAAEWREVKELLITDDFIINTVSSSVDGLYAWIDSKDIWPDINWDMELVKQRLSGQEGRDAVLIAYHALPEATDEDIADFKHRLSQVPPGVEILYNLCQFPDKWNGKKVDWREDQIADYMDALASVNDNLPAIFNFSTEFGQSASEENLILVKTFLRAIRITALAGGLLVVALIALIAGLKVRSRKALGKYVGIPLLAGGALVVLLALIGRPGIIAAVKGVLLSAVSDYARLEISNSLTRLMSVYFLPLLIQGAVIAGIGLLLLLLMLIKIPEKVPAEKEEPAV